MHGPTTSKGFLNMLQCNRTEFNVTFGVQHYIFKPYVPVNYIKRVQMRLMHAARQHISINGHWPASKTAKSLMSSKMAAHVWCSSAANACKSLNGWQDQ